MNTFPARVDANQAEIVAALRKAGATVQHIHVVGKGCPDVLVAFRGQNFLLEIKMPGKKLTPDEAAWHMTWAGPVAVVYSPDDALRAVGAIE